MLWLIWFLGVAIVPVAAAFVPDNGLPYPNIADLGHGLAIFSAWTLGFALMAYAMYRLRGDARTLAIAQLVAGLAFVFAHAMPSIDTYAYLGYGDQFLHGMNPWLAGPVAAYDGITHDFTAVWSTNPPSCRYGPAFVLFEAMLIRAFGDSVATLVVAQRVVSLLAAVAITLLVRGPNARYWALNPFVSYYFVLEAHNDVLFLLTLAIAARVRRPILQGALVGFGGMVKIVALASLVRRSPKRAVLSIASAALVVFVLYKFVPFALTGDGLRTQLNVLGNSTAAMIYSASVAVLGPHADINTVEVSVAVAFALLAFFIRWSRRNAWTYAVLLFTAALPAFWPWYLGWSLFASIMSSRRSTLRFVVALCLCSFLLELPYVGALDYYVLVTSVFYALAAILLFVCGIVPQAFAKPGDPGTLVWYVRRLVSSRMAAAR